MLLGLFCIENASARLVHAYVKSHKYNQDFKSYLKKHDAIKYKNIFYVDSIDKMYANRQGGSLGKYINLYTKPEIIAPNICSLNSYLYEQTKDSNWILDNKRNTRLISIIKSNQTCPVIKSQFMGYGPKTTPTEYIYVPNNISPKYILRLVNSKSVIQKQARWPEKHKYWLTKHKINKPILNKLESIFFNSSKNQYSLTYSCIGGCSCAGNLVFKVRWENNKFFKVIGVQDQRRGCI